MTYVPLQEQAREWGPAKTYPWRVLVVCVLVNKTHRGPAGRVARKLFEQWPSPELLANARAASVMTLMRPLGLTRRALLLQHLSASMVGVRTGRDLKRRGRQVSDLPGCGQFAQDAWAIFVEGRRDLEPADRVLAEWLDHLETTNQEEPDA